MGRSGANAHCPLLFHRGAKSSTGLRCQFDEEGRDRLPWELVLSRVVKNTALKQDILARPDPTFPLNLAEITDTHRLCSQSHSAGRILARKEPPSTMGGRHLLYCFSIGTWSGSKPGYNFLLMYRYSEIRLGLGAQGQKVFGLRLLACLDLQKH